MARNLSARQQRAIAALLTARNQSHAAELAGVPLRSLVRWLGTPNFREALVLAESEAISEATRRLTGLAGKAIENLEAMLGNPGLPAAQSVQVTRVVLDSLLKLRELSSLEERLSRLEKEINND